MRGGWEEVARRYTPPRSNAKFGEADGAALDIVQRAMFGFTVVELRHRRTGRIRFEYAYGDQTWHEET